MVKSQDPFTGDPVAPGTAIMNQEAAIQIFGAVVSNIACMIGPDQAFEAMEYIVQHKAMFLEIIKHIKEVAPPGTYSQEGG